MSGKANSNFENRFRSVVSRMRTTCVSTIVGWTLLALAVSFAIVVGCDFFFETAWSLRAILFFTILLTALVSCVVGILRSRKRWRRSQTAVEIESRFQDLGQSVRTSVQLNDGESHGFSKSLHQELNKEVEKQTQELRLGEAVPTGPLKIAIALLALVLITICLLYTSPSPRDS